MKLLTQEQRRKLRANGAKNLTMFGELDPEPVVKLFTPDAGCTWLLCEIDPDDEDHAFGLCDLGMGSPELGWVSLAELTQVRGNLGLPVERDLYFESEGPISTYARLARQSRRIDV